MSSGYEQVKLQESEEVVKILEERHVLDDEIKMVIDNAESTGEKLYESSTNRFLARLRIGEATFHVEYSVAGERTYTVHTAYAFRAEYEG